MKNKKIGLIDSGFGGLSILKELIQILPNESFVYFGDNKNAPYGERSKKSIIDLSVQAANFIFQKDIKLLIIACNTSCAFAFSQIKKELPIEVFEIISSNVKSLLNENPSKVGIIATRATIDSNIYEES